MNKIQMKYSKAQDITRKALGMAILKNREKVVALLKKYGVAVDSSYSNDELIVGVLTAVQANARFRQDLGNLLTQTTSESLNFTGESGMQFFYAAGDPESSDPWASITKAYAQNNPGQAIGAGSGPVANTTTPTTTTQKSALGSLLSDKNTLSSILNTGLSTLSTSLTNKSNQKLAKTALAIETEKTKQAQAAVAGGGAAPGTRAPISMGLKIGLAVGGAVLLTFVIVMLVKPKAKPKAA
jgi:hypothetical protein